MSCSIAAGPEIDGWRVAAARTVGCLGRSDATGRECPLVKGDLISAKSAIARQAASTSSSEKATCGSGSAQHSSHDTIAAKPPVKLRLR